MDIDQLNETLQTLSPSETEYRNGKVYDWSRMEAVSSDSIDGRQVMRLPSEVFSQHPSKSTLSHTQPPLTSRLFIKQHSRFNPMPEHVHSYLEMSYVYRGSCPQTVNGEHLLLRQNQVLLLDSDCPHAIGALGERDIMISICLESGFLARCLEDAREGNDWLTDFLITSLSEQADHNRHVLFNSECNHRLRRFFQELVCEYLDPSPHAGSIVLHLFQLIIAELMNVYEHDYVQSEQERSASGVSVVEAVRYLQEHYLTCTLEDAAKSFFVTPNYLSALLKRQTGKTYLQLVQEQKLAHAANLLSSGACTVEEAARAVGYENMSFFYRKFRAAYGTSPAEWRKN